MNTETYILLCLLMFIFIFAFKSILIVPQNEVFIIERLGKFYKLAPYGINIVIPLIDRARKKVSLLEQKVKIPTSELINSDILITCQIIDPVKAAYEIESFNKGLVYVVSSALSDIISKTTSETKIIEQLNEILTEVGAKWGIKINNIEIINSEAKTIPNSHIDFDAIKEFK